MKLRATRSLPTSLLVAALLVAYCGEGDPPGQPDAGSSSADTGIQPDGGKPGSDASVPGPDASVVIPPDAGAQVSCGDTCFANRDCKANEVCSSNGDDLPCCKVGARGIKEAGERCEVHEECEVGYCSPRNDGAHFCSGECKGDPDCPGSMYCGLFSLCVPKDADTPPSTCDEIGLQQCFYNDNCQDEERCEDVGFGGVELLCCKVGPRGTKEVGETCESGVDCAFGVCIGEQCSAECSLRVDPCARVGMVCNTIRGLCEPGD